MALDTAELMPDFVSARGVFCAVAWFATLFSLVLMVMSFFSIGEEAADAGVDDGDTGSFSLRACVGFLLGLGWGGFVSVQFGAGVGLASVIALLTGVVMFVLIGALMRMIYSLKADGSLNYADLVGMQGTVYVTIPPKGEPGGQVQVAHPSQLITMAAVQEGDTPLPAMTRIVVVSATTMQLLVRPVADADSGK